MIENHEIDDFAAEYVIGTLDQAERAEVDTLRVSNHALEFSIVAWEDRLAVLSEGLPDSAPSADLFPKIERRVLALSQSTPVLPGPPRAARGWRGYALAASVLFCVILGGTYVAQMRGSGPQFVASLPSETTSPLFTASLDPKAGTLLVHTATAEAPPGKNYELWAIPAGEKAPRAVKVLTHADEQIALSAGIDAALLRNATLAISVEPLGGSPSDGPTGPVIVTGTFREASR